jgi:hypothetical protein
VLGGAFDFWCTKFKSPCVNQFVGCQSNGSITVHISLGGSVVLGIRWWVAKPNIYSLKSGYPHSLYNHCPSLLSHQDLQAAGPSFKPPSLSHLADWRPLIKRFPQSFYNASRRHPLFEAESTITPTFKLHDVILLCFAILRPSLKASQADEGNIFEGQSWNVAGKSEGDVPSSP